MLQEVFARSDTECDIPICFTPEGGAQRNAVHAQIIALIKDPTMEVARSLAERLRDHTTSKSGHGLLFFLLGRDHAEHKLVISRFPANEGIRAEPTGKTLDLEFVERVFMRRATAYKAALYSGTSPSEHFWDGSAVDKQIGGEQAQLANYWIHGFLSSDFKITSAAGSRRLAIALRAALDAADDSRLSSELISLATLAPGLDKRTVSIQSLLTDFGLSQHSIQSVLERLPNQAVAHERFILSRDAFITNLGMRSVELDTGVTVQGPTERFDQAVEREVMSDDPQRVKLTATGRVIRERLKRSSR